MWSNDDSVTQAAKWLLDAAKGGYANAQYTLGQVHVSTFTQSL